jgi:hypothetical protein
MKKKYCLYVDPEWIRGDGVAEIPIPNQSEYAGCRAMVDIHDAEVDCINLNCLKISEENNEVVLVKTEDQNDFFIPFNRFIYAMRKENRFHGNKSSDEPNRNRRSDENNR